MVKKNVIFSLVFLLVAAAGFAALGVQLWLAQVPPPRVDGMLLEHEYAQTLYDNVTGISVSWSIVGDQIHMALQSPYRGWVGIGFSPNDAVTTQMLGADIWLGYVKDGQVLLEDQYGNTKVSHRPDPRGEGTEDILSVAGYEDERGTLIEFTRRLVTDDKRDKPIQRGKVFVELAYALDDDLFAYHDTARNTVRLDFFEGGVVGGIEHLEAYQVALLTWCFLFGLIGLQGLISTLLEGQLLHVRSHRPRPLPLPLMVYPFAFTVTQLWLAWSFFQLMGQENSSTWLGVFAALMLLMLANMVGFYRKYFMDDVVVAQARQDGVPW